MTPQSKQLISRRVISAALALLETNGLDPRNTDPNEHPTWIVGTKELAALFESLNLPERHTLYRDYNSPSQ